jgi:hypothetical protein
MKRVVLVISAVCVFAITPTYGFDDGTLLNLGPEELVQANGVDIQVPGYSVPSFVDWNNDKLNDLIIGEGGGNVDGKVRVYLNVGTESEPQFSDYFYAQSNGSDLTCPASGCLGCFPRVDYWDEDERKDLLVGQADGTIMIFLNIGTEENPTFDGGEKVRTGTPTINVGRRATPTVVDWNNDGDKDMVVGSVDGMIHVFINGGYVSSIPPDFDDSPSSGFLAQENEDDLVVPSLRSSPAFFDLDGDGIIDLLTGNTEGQLLFYKNFGSTGTDMEPEFSGYSLVESDGIPIDLPGLARSRPFICYWTGEGNFDPADPCPDVLVGAADGKVHLFRGIPEDSDDIQLNFGPEEVIQANGVDIQVPGYSVPSFVDWNNDKLSDLIIGEGGGEGDAKVRVYLNVGTESEPKFSDYFYAQSNGSDLTCPASGCMGCFPRVDYWNDDYQKDLLVGQADGTVIIFLNIGTDENPTFDGGTKLMAGVPGTVINVGKRATPTAVDWNHDGDKDLVVGALDGGIHVFINCGCGGSIPPHFNYSPASGEFAQKNGGDLVVPSLRSSPEVFDFDSDGMVDLLTGNTEGQILFYKNVGRIGKPKFSGYSLVTSNGVPIDLPGSPRSRPFLCYWTGEGKFSPKDPYLDLLVGAADGKVRLYRGIPKDDETEDDDEKEDTDGALLNLGPEELVQADGLDIQVPGYSVPSFVDWNNDKLNDLVIGEGGGDVDGKVRVYLNVGTESEPQFSDYFYAQSNGSDLTCPAFGWMGCFPRVDYWDADDRKDLLVGQADGTIKIFLNIGTDENPTFDGGTELLVGEPGTVIDVEKWATPTAADWNNDGGKDLVVGALDGRIHIFINCGCGGTVPPRFYYSPVFGDIAQENDADLVVPSLRSSPVIFDVDGDGKIDLLTGNSEGQLLFYKNMGTSAEPSFSGYELVESDGVPIDLAGSPRSRPYICYWTGEGNFGPADPCPDVLIGAADGKVHLYKGRPKDSDEIDEDEEEDTDGTLLKLGSEELVQANGVDIQVPGYSVPSFVDWNNDKLNDLIIGQGGGDVNGRIRVYLNVGTESEPQFSDFFYVRSKGSDLTCPASGCMGCFPRVDYWDADDRKDLLVGLADGTVLVYLNIGTDEEPSFGSGRPLKSGFPGTDIDVGKRATPTAVDWNSDGRKDLVVGALDGGIRYFLNCGCGGPPPHFYYSPDTGFLAQENYDNLIVPSLRSSPVLFDVDDDGKIDLLTGNTEGQILLYRNVGTKFKPSFSGYQLVESNGVPIDLAGSPRSRPFVCYWTGEGHFEPADPYPDMLVGAADGKVHLYRGKP